MYYTFIFLPPLSAEPHPYKEEDTAGEGPDGLLWQADFHTNVTLSVSLHLLGWYCRFCVLDLV